MNYLFECKIKYDLLNENHKFISETRTFIINALNQLEAESRIAKYAKIWDGLDSDAQVKSVKLLKNTEILFVDNLIGFWCKSKIKYKNTQKNSFSTVYVQAFDIESALKKIKERIKLPESGYKIVAIEEVNIDIFWENTESLSQEKIQQMTDSEKVKKAMELMKMTQSQFAKETGISAAALSHVLSGRNNLTSEMIENILVAIRQFNENLKQE